MHASPSRFDCWNSLHLGAFRRKAMRFHGGGIMATTDRPKCPACEFQMIHLPPPLMRFFGDVRAFQCQSCDFMVLLRHPFQLPADQDTQPRLDAAE
jgi:hypothetical protein